MIGKGQKERVLGPTLIGRTPLACTAPQEHAHGLGDGASLSISISGVPMGMMFSMSGLTLTATCAGPAAGSYSMKVAVQDSGGKAATAIVPITVAAK